MLYSIYTSVTTMTGTLESTAIRLAFDLLGRDRVQNSSAGQLGRSHHVYMVGQKMPFFNAAFFLLGQLSEHLAQMPAQISIQYFPSAFRDKNNMVLALPLRVA